MIERVNEYCEKTRRRWMFMFFLKPFGKDSEEPDMREFNANLSDPFGKLFQLHFVRELERMILSR